MKIALGADHAGYEYKELIQAALKDKGITTIDKGTYSEDSVDYPDYVHPVAELVSDEEVQFGILCCGSGNGVAMAANKHQEIRAAICWTEEIAELARLHNNANIICIPARFVSEESALKMVEIFIETEFEGGRHQRRVDKISC